MKKKIIAAILSISLIFGLCSCQTITREFGGETTIKLEPNQKLEEITWKGDSLWYLTRPMTSNDVAETHYFSESAALGVLEGTVIVIETKE